MWRSFSLRTRICLSLCVLFLFVAIAAVFMLREFASEQLIEENEPASRSAALIAMALNNAIDKSSEPHKVLEVFAETLKPSYALSIWFRPVIERSEQDKYFDDIVHSKVNRAPAWFVQFLKLPDIKRNHPILIDGKYVGDIVYEPTLAAEVREKWIGFLAIMAAGFGLAITTIVIAYYTIGSALRPLRNLGLGLARLRAGSYDEPIVSEGPPEILLSCAAANDLGKTLDAFHRENRLLLRKMVSIQDDERRDIARELHDELGPLLFSIRANTIAMVDGMPARDDDPAHRVMSSVEALQSTNRRILDRLRPHYIEELGISASIDTLVRTTRAQSPDLAIETCVQSSISELDAIATQTIYRILQESVTNVLRHANASRINLSVAVVDGWAAVEVRDNGVGLPHDLIMGRGLTGMRERVRALGGDFDIVRIDDWTVIRSRVPAVQAD